MQNTKEKDFDTIDEKEESKQSEFYIRYANSLVVNQNEEGENKSNSINVELKINHTNSEYQSSDTNSQQNSNTKEQAIKDKYQNMDGEKILRYIKAKLKTNPFQRWQMRNNKFPIKFLLHIVLIVFVTMQVQLMAKQEIDYTRFNIDFWKSTLLKINPDDEDNKNSKFFFTPKDLKENLDQTMDFFQNIQSQTQFDVVNYWQTTFYLLSYYTIWPTDKTHRLTYIDEINLKEGIVQPFDQKDEASLKQYTQKVNMFSLIISNLQTRFSVNSNICWDIKIQYIIESGIKVEASVDADQVMCRKQGTPPDDDPDGEDGEDKKDDEDDKDNIQQTLLKLKQQFSKDRNKPLPSDQALLLKQKINQTSSKLQNTKRRLIAESLSDYHIQQQWDKFERRKNMYSSITKPTKRGYQRIASPYKFGSKESYKPRRILVPIRKMRDNDRDNTTRHNKGFQTVFVNFMVILLSSCLSFLHIRYVYRIFVLYECAKQATERAYLQNIRLNQSKKLTLQNSQAIGGEQDKNLQQRKIRNILDDKQSLKWENITLSEKLKFFNKWQLLSMVGHFFQICGSILLFVSFYTLEKNASDSKFSFIFNLKERLIGFGCAIAWITIVQYVEYDREHIIFSNLMGKVVKQWLYTLIGILPVFMAFALVGYALYSESKFFHSMSYTLCTLFATYHGDQISDFMNSIKDIDSPLHQFYMLTFTCLFAMAVYNFFTSTIGLAWDEIKEKKQNKLLKQQLKENYLIEEELFKAKDVAAAARDSSQLQSPLKLSEQPSKASYDNILDNRLTLNSQNSGKKSKPLGMTQISSTSDFNSSQEEELIMNTANAFDKLNEFMNKNKSDKQKIADRIDKIKKFIWTDTISKKNQIEQLFKEMVEFDQIINVLDIDNQDRVAIKAKYRKYFNYTINSIHKHIDEISKY